MPTRFHTLSADAGEFQCHYCEVIMEKGRFEVRIMDKTSLALDTFNKAVKLNPESPT